MLASTESTEHTQDLEKLARSALRGEIRKESELEIVRRNLAGRGAAEIEYDRRLGQPG
jgi:hypothetical protein